MVKHSTNVAKTQFIPLGMNPLKFALWLFLVSFVMIFASMTSAYMVRRAEGNWLEFELPFSFTVNTIVLVMSSISMHYALLSTKRNNLSAAKIGVFATLFLGVVFLIGQFYAFSQLVNAKVFLVGNPAGSFVYLISGLHGAHIVGGLVFLIIVIKLIYKSEIDSKRILWMELCTTFWHFLDGLWLYLFFFLILNR